MRSLDSRAVRRSPRLAWKHLVEVFGTEERFRSRIDRLKEASPKGEDELLNLLDKYLGGWRPTGFNDD
jgi:hypothetical protein